MNELLTDVFPNKNVSPNLGGTFWAWYVCVDCSILHLLAQIITLRLLKRGTSMAPLANSSEPWIPALHCDLWLRVSLALAMILVNYHGNRNLKSSSSNRKYGIRIYKWWSFHWYRWLHSEMYQLSKDFSGRPFYRTILESWLGDIFRCSCLTLWSWNDSMIQQALRPYHQPKIFIEIILSRMMPTRWTFRNPFPFQNGTPQHKTMCDLQSLRWASMFRGRLGDFCPSCGKSCHVELDEQENSSFQPCRKLISNERIHGKLLFWGS